MSIINRAIRSASTNEYWYLAHQRRQQQQKEKKENDKQDEGSGQTD